MKQFAKKSLGQNFLIDKTIKKRIVDHCQLSSEEIIIEIGPGRGDLTRELAPKVGRLLAIEKDRDLIPRLQEEFEGKNVDLFCEDFLKTDLSKFPSGIKVVGNLPYYISTPILQKMIEHRDQFQTLYMTVQWEFGLRLTAKAGSKDYGSLSVFTQFFAKPEILFKIPNRSFRPIPKVSSCFMKIDFANHTSPIVSNEQLYFRIVRQAFTQRRKRISNSLNGFVAKECLESIFEQVQIDPKARAENLSVDDYLLLTEAIHKELS